MASPEVRPIKAGWWNVFRPWSLHGAVVPVFIGGAAAFGTIEVNPVNIAVFILILIGACLFQSAANILNTYGDYVKGTDTVENETRSPELVTGKLTPKQVRNMGIAVLVAICIIGIVLTFHAGWGLLIYGAIGLVGVVTYTMFFSYKYHGLGQLSVFICFGFLMPLGTFYTLTGQFFSLEVFLISVPNAFMITGVLAGNEMRDYYEDRKAGVGTLCGHLSYRNGMRLYLFEALVSFPILLILVAFQLLPVYSLLALLALYDAYVLVKNAKTAETDKHSSFMLVPLCFRLNWHFGALLVIGYILGMFF